MADAADWIGSGVSTGLGSSEVDDAADTEVGDTEVGDTEVGDDGGATLGVSAVVVFVGALVLRSGADGICPESRPVISNTVATTSAAAAAPISPNSQR